MSANERACVSYNVFKTVWFGPDLGWLGPAGSTCDNLVLSWRHRPSRVSLISQAACKQLWLMTNSYKRFSFSFFPPLTPMESLSLFLFLSFQLTESTVIFQCFSGGGNYNISRDQWTNDHSCHLAHFITIWYNSNTEHERLFTLKTLQDDMEIYCRRKVKTDCVLNALLHFSF